MKPWLVEKVAELGGNEKKNKENKCLQFSHLFCRESTSQFPITVKKCQSFQSLS